jgi:hypothetical protein
MLLRAASLCGSASARTSALPPQPTVPGERPGPGRDTSPASAQVQLGGARGQDPTVRRGASGGPGRRLPAPDRSHRFSLLNGHRPPCWHSAGTKRIALAFARLCWITRYTGSDVRGCQRLVLAFTRFRPRDGTANAVRVRALPGFKSPSLRSAPAPSPDAPGGGGLMRLWARDCSSPSRTRRQGHAALVRWGPAG